MRPDVFGVMGHLMAFFAPSRLLSSLIIAWPCSSAPHALQTGPLAELSLSSSFSPGVSPRIRLTSP